MKKGTSFRDKVISFSHTLLGHSILIALILFLVFFISLFILGPFSAMALTFSAGIGVIVYAIYDSRSAKDPE